MKYSTAHKVTCMLMALAFLVIIGCGKDKVPVNENFTKEELAKLPNPQRSGLPDATGGLVLSVKGEVITSDEIIEPFVTGATAQVANATYDDFIKAAAPMMNSLLKDKISNTLMFQMAKQQSPEGIFDKGGPLDKAVDTEVRKFISSFGFNQALAEEELNRRGMTWLSYREYTKKMLLTQSYFANEMNYDKMITYTDLVDYYSNNKDLYYKTNASLKFQLIDMKIDSSDELDWRDLKDKAVNIAKKAQNGEEFDSLVEKYSTGIKVASKGLWETGGKGSLASPYDILEVEADKLKPNQVSDPIEATGHIFIMKLIENQTDGYSPFQEVQNQIESRILFERRKQAMDKLLNKLIAKAQIGGVDSFLEYCVKIAYIRTRK